MKNFIKNNSLCILAILCLLSVFIIPYWISWFVFTIVILCHIFYTLHLGVKKSYEKEENKDDDIEPSKWCYVDKCDNCEYIVSVVYDNNDKTYRILENKSNVIFQHKFNCSDDAKQYIKEQAKDNYVIGLKCYNCVGNLIKNESIS